MQTFIPYPDFAESARVIDPSRLGNQVYRECYTLLNGGWSNHPASLMWEGHRGALADYGLACLDELARRGRYYAEWIGTFKGIRFCYKKELTLPKWLGDERIHASHRGCLLAKDPEWYGKFGWTEKPTPPGEDGKWPYVWPSDIYTILT